MSGQCCWSWSTLCLSSLWRSTICSSANQLANRADGRPPPPPCVCNQCPFPGSILVISFCIFFHQTHLCSPWFHHISMPLAHNSVTRFDISHLPNTCTYHQSTGIRHPRILRLKVRQMQFLQILILVLSKVRGHNRPVQCWKSHFNFIIMSSQGYINGTRMSPVCLGKVGLMSLYCRCNVAIKSL